MTFPSTHHSPMTVNKNATVFTIGTVRLSSATVNQSASHPQSSPTPYFLSPYLPPPPPPPIKNSNANP
jgi:hypothetical protein